MITLTRNKLTMAQWLMILVFLTISYFFAPNLIPAVNSSPNGTAKPLHFYLHNDISNPWVGGYTQTTATLNTTQKWRESPQGYENITGKLWLDFYVHPDLASDILLNGTIWLHPWMSGYGTGGSTIKGVFSATIYEVTSAGQTLVGSTASTGSQTLPYGSTPAQSRDVNSVAGNNPLILNFPPYTFRKGSSILIHIEVIPQGAGATMFFYYDHSISPSYVTLYSDNYVNISEIWTANATGYPETVFKALGDSTVVQINANVTDPLGGYDFNASFIDTKYAVVTATVVNPAGVPVVDNERMTLINGGITSFVNILQHNWTFTTAIPGQYNVTISATDNSGNTVNGTAFFWIGQTYRIQIQARDSKMRPLTNARIVAAVEEYTALSDYTNTTGWIDALIVGGTYNFTVIWQGVVVNSTLNFSVVANTTLVLNCRVYDPSFLFVDDVDGPLPEAQVFIEWPNGTTNVLPLYTTSNGLINLTQAPAGDYGFTLYWKGAKVLQETQSVNSDGPYTRKCHVYQLTVQVLGNDGASIRGAYVVISTQEGTVYDFKVTNATGQATFKVPIGTYRYTVWWEDVIVQETVQNVNSSGLYTMICQVYQFTVQVLGNNGVPIQGAYVVISAQEGTVYDFKVTNASGMATFRLPVGTYKIETYYSTAYWLTHVAVSTTESSVSVPSSGPVTITLTDFPPSLWTTVGFWLLIALIIVVVLGTVGFLYKRGLIFKGKAPKTK